MNLDMLNTHTLLASVEQTPPLHTFLRDRFFPTANGDIFSTHDVLVEYKDGTQVVAPIVAPRKGGVTVLRDGYEVKQYEPAYIAPRRALTVDDLEKRQFGEALYSNMPPAQRALAITTLDMQELSDMITRREEQMCAEVMQTNKLSLVQIADDKETGEPWDMAFYSEGTNPATYTPTANWSTTSTTILGDIKAMIGMLVTRGLGATDLIVGADVADILINNAAFKELLDIRRYELGNVDPAELPSGAARLMTLNVYGRMINVFSYDEQYTDFATGETKPYIDPKNVILTAPGAGRIAYGAVTQMEETDRDFHTYTGKRIPKVLTNAEGETRTITLKSRPIVMPKAKNPFIVAKVLA